VCSCAKKGCSSLSQRSVLKGSPDSLGCSSEHGRGRMLRSMIYDIGGQEEHFQIMKDSCSREHFQIMKDSYSRPKGVIFHSFP